MDALKQLFEAEFDALELLVKTEENKRIFMYAIERGYILGMNKPLIQIKNIDMFLPDIQNNTSFRDLTCMKNRISVDKYNELVDTFVVEQRALTKVYTESSEVFKHLGNWIRYNLSNPQPAQAPKNNNTKTML
jgi:hypothetical protein